MPLSMFAMFSLVLAFCVPAVVTILVVIMPAVFFPPITVRTSSDIPPMVPIPFTPVIANNES